MSQENSCNSSQGSNSLEVFPTSALETDDHERKSVPSTCTLLVDVPKNNECILRCFYNALAMGNTGLLSHLLAEDLDLWFHGPRCHQHMSKLLTGVTSHRSVALTPSSILATRNFVIAEGVCGEVASWVHIWTVEEGKLIQLREFWNTAVWVSFIACVASDSGTLLEPPSPIFWTSKLWHAVGGTKPGLLVTI
ncbi:hypothetical protein KC19_1G165000 [Ceratodon purpureus]|uniref:Uncharacterized protein n=1 Tax=Ceratodon purpureus TaxID=3225 RepID=A0A8T0J5W3_CERPU|nr:hypothetical protein KC19_1G165000 [Ceratodon purpureus]